METTNEVTELYMSNIPSFLFLYNSIKVIDGNRNVMGVGLPFFYARCNGDHDLVVFSNRVCAFLMWVYKILT